MKHVFTIHSPITFLVAYSIVEHLQLNVDQVVFICSNYQPPINKFNCVPSFTEQNKGILKKLKTLNVPEHYDRYIYKIVDGKEFTAYVDLMSYYQKILVTHYKCKQFHFFEEGNSAYMAWDDDKDLTWEDYTGGMGYRVKLFDRVFFRSLVRVIRGYNLRILSLPYHYMAYVNFKYIKFFSFSANAFFNAPESKKVIVKPNPFRVEITKMAGEYALQDESIWLDGSNSRYTGLDDSYYQRAIGKAISVFKRNGVIKEKVYIKLRPGIKDVSENKLYGLLVQNHIEVEVLPDDMIIECFFMTSKNCNIIGNLTSALEYAHVFGHKSYSIYPFFEKQPPTLFDRMTGFWNNIETVKK